MQFVFNSYIYFWAPEEATLAADLVTAWKSLRGGCASTDLVTAFRKKHYMRSQSRDPVGCWRGLPAHHFSIMRKSALLCLFKRDLYGKVTVCDWQLFGSDVFQLAQTMSRACATISSMKGLRNSRAPCMKGLPHVFSDVCCKRSPLEWFCKS